VDESEVGGADLTYSRQPDSGILPTQLG
jgi:hypothetical protein